MAEIIRNEPIASGIWRMVVSGAPLGRAGQFHMLRVPGALDPLLSEFLAALATFDNVNIIGGLRERAGRNRSERGGRQKQGIAEATHSPSYSSNLSRLKTRREQDEECHFADEPQLNGF